ncbi:unnamed protein product, partial [Medioppia subpectinata]
MFPTNLEDVDVMCRGEFCGYGSRDLQFTTLSKSSYGQFKNCVNDPLLRECGRRARGLMDHSMGFLISRCSQNNLNRCPNPMSTSGPLSTTTTEEPFDDQNDLGNRARADRSFDELEASEASEETESSVAFETTTHTWNPRTVVYTLPPEP